MIVLSSKKVIVFISSLSVLVAGLILYYGNFAIQDNVVTVQYRRQAVTHSLPLEKDVLALEQKKLENTATVSRQKTEEAKREAVETQTSQNTLPPEFLLPVPFAPQSPDALWDERDEESCEEASIVMVHYFLQKKDLTREGMRKELDHLIDFQISHYGDYRDSDAAGIARLARDYYGYQKVRVDYDISLLDLKKEIAAGNPVIVPAAGQSLKNPYFTPPGPLYHNLVLIGFNAKGFITNDPGTRRGEHYFYPYPVLDNAIHDFPGSKEKILEGRKAMIVIRP